MILKIEKKAIEYLEKNYKIICYLILVLMSFVIRYLGKDFISADASVFLIPWYDTFAYNGGVHALDQQIGNYNMLYQTCIALFTYIPIRGIYCYKLFSILFDYFLGGAVACMAYFISEKARKKKAAYGFIITVLSPLVIMNSSIWAQCDSIYTFFCLGAIFLLIKEKHCLAFIFWGLAFSFKVQAIFIFPFFVLIYLLKKRFSIFCFFIVPITMIVTAAPNILFFGRTVEELFYNYVNQAFYSTKLSYNYPSVLLLPCMHERYGYVYEIMAIIILLINVKTILPFLALMFLTNITYGHFLFDLIMPTRSGMGYANLIIFGAYNIILWKQMVKTSSNMN